MDIIVGTSKSNLSRAWEALRNKLEKAGLFTVGLLGTFLLPAPEKVAENTANAEVLREENGGKKSVTITQENLTATDLLKILQESNAEKSVNPTKGSLENLGGIKTGKSAKMPEAPSKIVSANAPANDWIEKKVN